MKKIVVGFGELLWDMLPQGRLGDAMYTKLHVYEGPEHKHQAQKPEELKF